MTQPAMTDRTVLVTLSRPLPARLEAELGKRIHFISPDVHDFAFVRGDEGVEALRLTLVPEPADTVDELTAKINRVVEREVRVQRAWQPKVLWTSARRSERWPDPLPEMERAGLVHVPGPGTVTFGDLMIRLIDHLDQQVRAIAVGMPDSTEYRYPTLLPLDVLERQNYFESFPHFVMFVSRLHNDADNYEAFLRRYREAGRQITPEIFSLCRDDRYCLPPTMCYHTFNQLFGTSVDQRVVTSRGKSFRFESRYEQGLDRLWDFTIRETVFLGPEAYVVSSRRRFLEAAFALFDRLGLAARCEVANDHFFGDASKDSVLSQRLMELKYEMVADVAEGRSIAVGSFNLHGSHFGEVFDISHDAAPTHTGCVGFGLERLAYAFVTQHGVDPDKWPETVRAGVSE
jgi:seryl-tRNA synthetase